MTKNDIVVRQTEQEEMGTCECNNQQLNTHISQSQMWKWHFVVISTVMHLNHVICSSTVEEARVVLPSVGMISLL